MNFFKSLFGKKPEKVEDEKVNNPYTIIPNTIPNEDLSIMFAEKYTLNKGKFFFCEDENDLKENILSIFENEGIELVFCNEDSIFDLLVNFDVGFSEIPNESCQAALICCDYLEAKTGKVYLSKQKKEQYRFDELPDRVIIFANEKQLLYEFINLYNDYYSLQNTTQNTTFSIFKKNLILLLIESKNESI